MIQKVEDSGQMPTKTTDNGWQELAGCRLRSARNGRKPEKPNE